jgi:acetyl esterase/lipase
VGARRRRQSQPDEVPTRRYHPPALSAGALVRIFTGIVIAVLVALLAIHLPRGAHAKTRASEVWANPPYREVTHPGTTPIQGRILLIHGGSWHGSDPRRVIGRRPRARFLARQGWLVWNVDYRSDDRAFPDVRRWLRLLAQRHRRLPLCAYGSSAGGHLALLLAARSRIRLDCVISEAGPTDLARVGEKLQPRVRAAFGDRLDVFSPLHYALQDPRRLRRTKRILLASGTDDQTVPIDQVRDFARALPRRSVFMPLSPGHTPFVHTKVDKRDARKLQRRQRRMLARVAAARPTG